MDLFGAASESKLYMDFAVLSFRIYLCLMSLALVNKGCFIFLQALGKGKESAAIALCREVVFGIGLPVILGFTMGLNGILLSFPAADLLTAIISVFVIMQIRKELKENQSVQQTVSSVC